MEWVGVSVIAGSQAKGVRPKMIGRKLRRGYIGMISQTKKGENKRGVKQGLRIFRLFSTNCKDFDD